MNSYPGARAGMRWTGGDARATAGGGRRAAAGADGGGRRREAVTRWRLWAGGKPHIVSDVFGFRKSTPDPHLFQWKVRYPN